MTKSKKMSTMTQMIIVGAVLAIVVLAGMNYLPASVIQDQLEPRTDVSVCDSTTTPEVTIDMFDADNPGSSITEVMSWRIVGKSLWTMTNTGTAITGLTYNDKIEYVVGINGTTDAELYDNAYSNKGTFIVKCQESESIEVEGHNDEIEGSITATFYNADDTASTAETISAGMTDTVFGRFVTASDEEFGNRYTEDYPNMVVIKVNTTSVDDVPKVYIVSTEVGQVNAEMMKVGCPSIVSAETSFTNYCFKAPIITDKGVKLGISIEAYSSGAIVTDATLSYYAGNWFINADTGALDYGIQDEDGNACGASDPDTLTLDLT